MTCVGVWVVIKGSVSCLGNSQVITKKLPGICKFAPDQLLPVVTCVGVTNIICSEQKRFSNITIVRDICFSQFACTVLGQILGQCFQELNNREQSNQFLAAFSDYL